MEFPVRHSNTPEAFQKFYENNNPKAFAKNGGSHLPCAHPRRILPPVEPLRTRRPSEERFIESLGNYYDIRDEDLETCASVPVRKPVPDIVFAKKPCRPTVTTKKTSDARAVSNLIYICMEKLLLLNQYSSGGLHSRALFIGWLLALTSFATAASPNHASTKSIDGTATIQTLSSVLKPVTNRKPLVSTLDILIFSIGAVICVSLLVASRCLRKGWKLPGPVMFLSSSVFFELKNSPDANNTFIWVVFAIWLTAISIFIWTTKLHWTYHNVPSDRLSLFTLTSVLFVGVLAYIFAPVLKEPTATALPMFASFAVAVCDIGLSKWLGWLNQDRHDIRLPLYATPRGDTSLREQQQFLQPSLPPL